MNLKASHRKRIVQFKVGKNLEAIKNLVHIDKAQNPGINLLNNGQGSRADSSVQDYSQNKQNQFSWLTNSRRDEIKNLSNVQYQARDRHLLYLYPFRGQFSLEEEAIHLEQWLGQMHFKIVSASFDLLINKQLNFEQVKIYCSENLLLNIVMFLDHIKACPDIVEITERINTVLNKNLEYLLMKYPQTKQMKPNKNLREAIISVNNLENDQNDMLLRSPVTFSLREDKNYFAQIMHFLNYLIQQQSKTIYFQLFKKRMTYSQAFYEMMQFIFQTVFTPDDEQDLNKLLQHGEELEEKQKKREEEEKRRMEQQKKQQRQQQQQQQNIVQFQEEVQITPQIQTKQQSRRKTSQRKQKAVPNKVMPTNKVEINYKEVTQQQGKKAKQIKQYQQKISKYTSYKIGMKISPNCQTYSDIQIESGFFEVKNTGLLRILAKWSEELEKKIKNADKLILNRSFRFKNMDKKKSFLKLSAIQKNYLYQQANKQIMHLKQFVKQLSNNCFEIEGILGSTMQKNDKELHIPLHQYMVGEFSTKLQSASSSSLIYYLNEIIHLLLSIPENVKKKKDIMKDLNLTLITFKIGDIFRCKCLSHENEILRILKVIIGIGQRGQPFKIVRIKDRLDIGTRDILINILFMNKFLAQIQLAVIDEIEIKQQNYDNFNHFLYELKRSDLGPIMESACIWAHLDQRSKYFRNTIQNYSTQSRHFKQSAIIHSCKATLKVNKLSFVCSLCKRFYSMQKGIIENLKCQDCGKYYQCAKCIEQSMEDDQLKEILQLKKKLDGFHEQFRRWKNRKEQAPYPKFGLIIPRNKKKVDSIFFFTTILVKPNAYVLRVTDTNQIEIVTVVEENSRKSWQVILDDYVIYEWTEKKNFNRTYKPSSMKEEIRMEAERIKEEEKERAAKRHILKAKLKQKRKEENKFWEGKDHQNDKRSRKISSRSDLSDRSSKKSVINEKTRKERNKNKLMAKLPSILEKTTMYIETIAQRSEDYQVRIAQRKLKDDKNIQCLILGVYKTEGELRGEIKYKNNVKLIYSMLRNKMEVLFIEDEYITDQFMTITSDDQLKYHNSLIKISQIYLDSNFIASVSFLEIMPALKIVHLNFNKIQSLEGIEKCTELTYLHLANNLIEMVSNLQKLENLIELILDHNRITSIDGLSNLQNLQILEVSFNEIYELKNLSSMNQLIILDLSYNHIENLQSLHNFEKLQELDLSGNSIKSIPSGSFVGFESLISLKLNKNFISQIQNLEHLIQLQVLELHGNKIKKIDNISHFFKLIHLDLSKNLIITIQNINLECLSVLYLSNIQVIYKDNNRIKFVQNLLHCSSIVKLDLSHNCIRQLNREDFQFMEKLKYFYIYGNMFPYSPILKGILDEFSYKYKGFHAKPH